MIGLIKLVFVYIFIPLVGNLITSIWAFTIAPMVFSSQTNIEYHKILKDINYITISITFLTIFIIFLYLIYPILKMQFLDKTPTEFEKRRVLNVPIYFSIIIFIAWCFSTLIGDIYVYKIVNLDFPLSDSPILYSMGFNLFSSLFSFILFFYILEFMNRIWFIPWYIPENKISNMKGVWKISVRHHFLIFTFFASVYPISLFMFAIYNIQNTTDQVHINRLILSSYIAGGFLIFLSFLIMFFLSHLYQSPLLEMKSIALDIGSGNYDHKFKLLSTDEIGVLGESLNTLSSELKDKEFLKESFGKMVSPEVRDYLLEKNLNLGGDVSEITILFSDLRGFTSLSETMPPDKIVEVLNLYFEQMTIAISQHNGLVNKYIGDAILAIFGTPLPNPAHPKNAILAAIEMEKSLIRLNETLAKKKLPQLKMGIGIHTGSVLVGNVGSSHRMEFTVIGDSVNLASRLESPSKEFENTIIISSSTYEKTSNDFSFIYLGQKLVKGKTIPIDIYTIKGI